MYKKSDIGLIGLAVMGENLALNMERNGFKVSVYNRPHIGGENPTDRFMNDRGKNKNFEAFTEILEFVASLESPRKIMMMIRAGKPVDMVIEQLLPLLEPGDIVIDGGNSNYEDTERRELELREKGVFFVGTGISGGEEGALNGPSIMPGGAEEAWPHIKPIFQKIAAKAEDGEPCCTWIGKGGAGHFVKMVHNGIEYGDMQLIAEAYGLMKSLYNMSNDKMSEVFTHWNKGKLDSYLVEITAHILNHRTINGTFLLDEILDTAGQKGTGKWSVISSLEFGVPLNLICTAVYERNISALKDLRLEAAAAYIREHRDHKVSEERIQEMHDSLYASKLVSYAQGFQLLTEASAAKGWNLDLAAIARIWRGGCIIRSVFLNRISDAYVNNPLLRHLLLDEYFKSEIINALPAWKNTVAEAAKSTLPAPAFSSALNYFYSLSSERLSANMLQAQRDYFGAHTFERIDKPRGEFFHENWTGIGGDTKSTNYNV
ncbi:decarboxylating NADP(+)-dependent phosphogluconate dehydrogenase [Porphyromonas pogonae]|uniref:decarboxylating NADP(+)-dependent phosphogluconate dehydrogenase n=1 Tax=Porphyromonas pogonae TaxID=867595 RepID=UPI002E763A6B|nr:decarboxylating NADP(+)-dependent phosphogluconate dehydrogenase [Porphyromonas pogonae]